MTFGRLGSLGRGFGRLGSGGASVSSTPPTNLALSASTVNESDAAGTVVGTLTATAPAGTYVLWTIVDDASGRFEIGGVDDDTLKVSWTQFDRSVATSHSVTVRATAYNYLGVSQGSADLTSSITVADVTDPGELATAIVLGGSFRVSSDYTLSGSNITAIAAKWSASGGAITPNSGQEPLIAVASGPAGQTVAQIQSGDAPGLFTAVTGLTAFTYETLIAFGNTNQTYLLSHTSNTANWFRLADNGATGTFNRLTFRAGSNGADVHVALSPALRLGRFYRIKVIGNGTALTVYADGTQIGSSNSASGTWSFSRMGLLNAAAPTAAYYQGDFAFYGDVLSAGDQTSLGTWLEPGRRQRTYVAAAGSDSSVAAWLSASPVLTVSRGIASVKPGDAVLFNRGDTWRAQPIALATSGTSAAPIVFGAYGTGNLPRIWGPAAAITSGWTNTSGNTWERALTDPPKKVWLPNTEATNSGHLWDNALSSDFAITDFYFTHAAGVLTIELANGIDPNTLSIEIAPNNTDNAITTSADYHWYKNLDIRYWARSAVALGGAGRQVYKGLYIGFCAADGIDTSSTSHADVADVEIEGVGVNWFAGSSDGDPFSAHGTSSGAISRSYIHRNLKSGALSERSTTTSYDRTRFVGNNQTIGVADQGTGDGAITLTNNLFLPLTQPLGAGSAASSSADTINLQTGAGTLTVNMFGNTIYSDNPANGFVGIHVDTSAGTVTATANGNIITGMASGSVVETGETLTENYNDYFNNTTDRTGSHNAGAGAGANDVDTDPQFVDAANDNFKPQVALTANDNSLTYDYYGIARDASPTMGAVEA